MLSSCVKCPISESREINGEETLVLKRYVHELKRINCLLSQYIENLREEVPLIRQNTEGLRDCIRSMERVIDHYVPKRETPYQESQRKLSDKMVKLMRKVTNDASCIDNDYFMHVMTEIVNEANANLMKEKRIR